MPRSRLDHGVAVLGVELQQDLGVGSAAEDAPLGLQLGAQLAIIVDLAVERDD